MIIGSRVVNLTIAAGPKSAESYQLSQAIAKKLTDCKSNINLKVLETQGSDENLKLLQQGKVQLASIPVNNSIPPTTRLVSFLFNDLFQIIVSEESGIKTIADLKGKRLAIPVAADRADDLFWILAKHYRLSQKDINVKPMMGIDSNIAFLNNQIDAVFRLRPSGNKQIQELVQQGKAQIIPIDQAAALKIQYPELESAVIPKGIYQGNIAIPENDLPTISIRRVLISSDKVDADAIYEITRILYEHRQFLTNAIPLAQEISPPDKTSGLILPIHPGAERYYDRDKPGFISENSDVIGLIMSVFLGIVSWLWQLKENFTRVQKNRSDQYNRELLQLIDKIKQCEELDSLNDIKNILHKEFSNVIEAYDKDEITIESLQSIRFTWEATVNAIRDQETYILYRSHLQR